VRQSTACIASALRKTDTHTDTPPKKFRRFWHLPATKCSPDTRSPRNDPSPDRPPRALAAGPRPCRSRQSDSVDSVDTFICVDSTEEASPGGDGCPYRCPYRVRRCAPFSPRAAVRKRAAMGLGGGQRRWWRVGVVLASTRSSQLSYTRDSEEVLVAARVSGVNQCGQGRPFHPVRQRGSRAPGPEHFVDVGRRPAGAASDILSPSPQPLTHLAEPRRAAAERSRNGCRDSPG
jgi:hypothetical protein